MIHRKFAVHKLQRPARFAQIAFALGLSFMIAGPSMRVAARPLQSISIAPRPLDWTKFDTDACGSLANVEGGSSILVKSSGTDEDGDSDDDGDEDNWMGAWGMSAGASALAEEWILQHPQVAIVSDAIDKSCGGDDIEDGNIDVLAVA
jgi:hypothetical protein